MQYSGRTTAYSHKHDGWQTRKCDGVKAIQQKTIFEVQWSDCPVEVEDEVRKLWIDAELGNDRYFYNWVRDDDEKKYPIIGQYLRSKGVKDCWIRWWW